MNGGSRRVSLRFPAKAEYITLGRLALTGLAHLRPLPHEVVADLKLALTEACSNSVRHAYRDGTVGAVEITYELAADRLAIEVVDDGPGFEYVQSEQDEHELVEGGLGIAIIRALTDEFELDTARPGGSRLRFAKYLPA
jgi:serine/threonine-protein kinase RsbW